MLGAVRLIAVVDAMLTVVSLPTVNVLPERVNVAPPETVNVIVWPGGATTLHAPDVESDALAPLGEVNVSGNGAGVVLTL